MENETNQAICPWCESHETVIKSSLPTSTIIQKYRDDYGIEVERLFSSDRVFLFVCRACDLQFFQGSKPGDLEFYEAITKNPKYYSEQKPEFDFILDRIQKFKPRSLLDFGSGGGGFLKRVRDVPEKRGLEFTQSATEILKRNGILLHQPEVQYDFITCFQVLEHLHQYSELRDCVKQNLKPGAYLFISTPNPDSPDFSEIFQILDCPPHHLTRWSAKAFRAFGRSLGLEEQEYFQEPYSRAMLFELMKIRRRQVTGEGIRARVFQRVGEIFDRIYLPYSDVSKLQGPTHGMLFKKMGSSLD